MILAVVGTVVLIVGLLWVGQRRLIYLPDRTTPLAPHGVEEVSLLTADELELAAWWLAGDSEPDVAVIVFPGNAGNRAGRLTLAERLVDEGFGVLLVDYRGYGGNPGSPSEDGLIEDARAARAWVDGRGLDRVVYLGESLGAGPATALALESPPEALVLRSPFTSLPDAARVHYPFLPVGLLVWDRFPVEDQVAMAETPVVVVAGSDDGVVPVRLSLRVAEAAGSQPIIIEGADHNDAVLTSGPTLIDAVIRATD